MAGPTRRISSPDEPSATTSSRSVDHGAMTREAMTDGRIGAWQQLDVTERRAAAGRRSGTVSRQRSDAAIKAAVALDQEVRHAGSSDST